MGRKENTNKKIRVNSVLLDIRIRGSGGFDLVPLIEQEKAILLFLRHMKNI